MERVGKNLATANAAYNQMVGSFESQVLTQARRFETLGAGSAKDIADAADGRSAPAAADQARRARRRRATIAAE